MDAKSYALSKQYTDLVAIGLASATVDDANKSITFTLASDGSQHTIHFNQPSDGQDGVSVTGISDKGNGVFTLLFSDGSESDPIQCVKGEDGVSPTAKIEKVGDTATITITDKDGTTTATIKDGQGGSGGTVDVPIEKIKVNGELQTPVNKVVDITVPSIEGLTKDADLATVAKSGSYEDLSNKPEIPSLDGYAKTSEIPSKVSELENDSNYLSSIPEEYVTETELSAKGYLTEHQDISGKVDKVEGKSLISDTEIARLATVDNYDDTDIKAEIAKKADTTAIPSKVSELTNDSNYQTAEQVNSTVTTEIAKVVADAPESLNTLKEMSDWIAGHEDDASAMNSAISDNKTAITALQTGKADKSDIPTTVAELTDSADYAKTADVNNSISALQTDKANASDLTAHTDDANIHVTAENKTLWNTVSNKVNKEDGKALLADTDKTNYDDAVTKAHTHENKEVLDGITSDKVTYWDNKSEFSGSYNDLNDKPTIDAELSNTSENAIQNKVVTKEINKLYSDISFNDFDTATDGISFTDAEDGNMIVTDCTKNLLNPTLETCEVNGVTCTRNVDANGKPDGTYTLNGTATAAIEINKFLGRFVLDKYDGSKLNCLGQPYGFSDIYLYFGFYDSNNRRLFELNPGTKYDSNRAKDCSNVKYIDVGMYGRLNEGKELKNVLLKPMLTTDLNTTYDDFVPYGGYEIQSCGKNLFDNVEIKTNTMNIEAKLTDDAGIKLNGTTPYDPNWKDVYVECQATKLEKGKTYCLSVKDALDGLYIILRTRVYSTAFKELNLHDRFIIFTWDKDDEYIRYTLTVKSQQTFDNVTVYPQLEEVAPDATDPTDFEPYTGETITVTNDTESPAFGLKSHKGITNIISPGNVKCVYPTNESGKGVLDSLYNKDKMLTEQNKNLEVLGKCKNLLNPTLQTTTQNGVTCTNNGDGTYTLNGTASGDAWFTIENIPKFEDKIYKIVGFKNPTDSYYTFINAVRKLDEFVEFSKLHEKYNPTAYLSNDVYKGINIGIAVTSGTTLTNEIVKPMLTTDLNATYDDFVPYTGEGETLTHDVAEIKNDLGGMVTKQGHFGSNKTDFTLENLYEGFQQFMITTLYRATGEPNDCDGYIIIHKESSSGIKSFKVYGASGVTVSYDSSSNKITLTTTKPYMSLYVTSNKNFDIV